MSTTDYLPGSRMPVVVVEDRHIHIRRLGGGSHESYTHAEWDAMVSQVEEGRKKAHANKTK